MQRTWTRRKSFLGSHHTVTSADSCHYHRVPNAICMFEADTNYPIRRHFGAAQNYTSVARNIAFTVRWIATVGNYDYLFDYTFFYDGAIEVSVRASGYISAAYIAENDDYGFKIHDQLSGALHDHVMTFKVDLDILGRENSVQKVEVVPATVEYPWSAGKARKTMKLEKSFITHEDILGIPWAPNDAANYAIVNKDSPNKYGEYPGYRIKRGKTSSSRINWTKTDYTSCRSNPPHHEQLLRFRPCCPLRNSRSLRHETKGHRASSRRLEQCLRRGKPARRLR